MKYRKETILPIIQKVEYQIHGGIHPKGFKSLSNTKNIEWLSSDKSNVTEPLFTTISDWKNTDRKTLIERIRAAKVVGLGGAIFPTHIKLKNKVKTLIVNSMECEPYITCDDRLLRENADDILQGTLIAAHIVSATEILFGIEDNKPEAIKALEESIKDFNHECLQNNQHLIPINIIVTPTKYPSGGEKQLIELLTGKQVPQKQHPSSIGILVQNIATLYAVYQAVVLGLALTHRLVTVTGDLVEQAGNYWIAIGTPLTKVLSALNIQPNNQLVNQRNQQCEIIFGGPLMGKIIYDFNALIKQSTNCIIINQLEPANLATQNRPHDPCIRCGECESVCPVSLLPQQLYWFSQSEQWDDLKQQNLFDCIECNACSYVCPSNIPLVNYYQFSKSEINYLNNKQIKSDIAKQRFDNRERRLEKIKLERDKKRKIKAETRRIASMNKEKDPEGKKSAIQAALDRVKAKKEQC